MVRHVTKCLTRIIRHDKGLLSFYRIKEGKPLNPENSPLAGRFYTPTEIAEALRVKERVVLDLLRGGKIKGVKVGKEWRVRESELRAFLGHEKGVTPDSGD
jgi:excisionase family DNA binding protein